MTQHHCRKPPTVLSKAHPARPLLSSSSKRVVLHMDRSFTYYITETAPRAALLSLRIISSACRHTTTTLAPLVLVL